MKDVGGAVLAGSTLALESVKESSAAVSKPRGVWLRMPIVKNLEEARRLPMMMMFITMSTRNSRRNAQSAGGFAVNLMHTLG